MRVRILSLLLVLPWAVQAQPLPEFRAVYDTQWKGLHLGEIVISLHREQGQCYRYESQARPVALVRMFYGKPRELSRFCIVDGKVQPRQFVYEAGEDSFELNFDWGARKVVGGEGERDLPEDAQDRLGLQQAVRLWVMEQAGAQPSPPFRFTLVQEDKMDQYELRLTGTETVEVPDGRFEALRLDRTDRDDRIARFWLAASRDYMPVKVETGKEEVDLRMSLKSFERLGEDTG